MKIGVCIPPEQLAVALPHCDYVELPFGTVAALPEADFAALKAEAQALSACIPAMNLFLPGTFRLTGPEADLQAPLALIETGMQRCRELGTRRVVFGSAGARSVPEGACPAQAREQLIAFLRLAGPIAQRYGVLLCIEPLGRGECNLINTVSEGYDLFADAAAPGTAVLADYYHMCCNHEDMSGIIRAGSHLHHCHIAYPDGRRYPLPEQGYDFSEFFQALRTIGYDECVSIEGNTDDLASDLPRSVQYLKTLCE